MTRVARSLTEYTAERIQDIPCDLIDPHQAPGLATDTTVWDPVDPDHREGFIHRSDRLRPADVAEAILFVATRPPNVLIDWLRLGPSGKTAAMDDTDGKG